jgi:DNA-binding HxlR family transcriptional regulator
MRFEELADTPCSISRALTVVGERWTLAVVKQAFAKTRRFEDFLAALGVSRALLSNRLERLVEAGVLEKRPYQSNRTRYEYRLTDAGLALYPVLQALRSWGDEYLAPDGPPLLYTHKDCGGGVTVQLNCDSCQSSISPRDVEVSAGPGLNEEDAAALPWG